jgi:hypothetical protein
MLKEDGFSNAAGRIGGLFHMSSRQFKVWLVSAAAFPLCQQGLLAQSTAPPQYREEAPVDLEAATGTTADWKAVVTAAVEPRREFESDEGASQSRICFARATPGTNECYYFRDLFHSNLTFQVLSSLTIVRLQTAGGYTNGVELKAAARYPTGQIPETAIWVHDAQRDVWHVALAVESSEVRIFGDGPFDGVLVTSDWHREEGEVRWGEHRRDIAVYRYSVEGGQAGYRNILAYTTFMKYDPEDADTIDAELSNIADCGETKLRMEQDPRFKRTRN